MYTYYYIDETPEDDDLTIELPDVIIEDYGKCYINLDIFKMLFVNS